MKTHLLVLGLLLLSLGCQSPERTAYVTIGSLGATANAAIGSYHSYVQTHEVPPAQLQEARRLVQSYVDALEAARAVVVSYKAGRANRTALVKALDALEAVNSQLTGFFATITSEKEAVP